MKRFSILVLSLFILNCNESPVDSRCESYCNHWESAYLNEAEVYECSIEDERLDEFSDECNVACVNAYYSSEQVYEDNVNECLDCINSTLDGGQRVLDFDDLMWGECQNECKLTTEFFASFFVIEPTCN